MATNFIPRGYGRSFQGPQRNPLSEALAAIMARRNAQQAPVEAPAENYYASDWLAPYLPDLSPLGRFTDMGMRQQASQHNAGAAVEAAKAMQVMNSIQRTTDPMGQTVSSFPSGGQVISQQPAGPISPASPLPPTSAVAYSPSGQVVGSSTTAPRTTEATFEGMPASEWFQRAANRQGGNAFAKPEPGFQGVPFSLPGTNDYNAWEKATAMIRKTKPKG